MIFDTPAALAETIAADLKFAVQKNDKALLILPGGSSPVPLMEELAKLDLPWHQITVTTTDERDVPLTDPQSNAGQVKNILGIRPVWLCDERAETLLEFPASVTVLGMGMDAHIASLFPGAPLPEGRKIVRTTAPFGPHERLTLTLETLLDTKRLILLAPGSGKQALIAAVTAGKHPGVPLESLLHKAKEKLEIWAFDV